MTSPARLAANRRNALRSTGPRSVGGKAASSGNATRHGLLSRQPLLADEDPVEYDQLRQRLLEAHSPDGVVEELIVNELTGLVWRLQRLAKVEVALFTIGAPAPVQEALRLVGEADAGVGAAFASQAHAFATLSRYEVALANRLRRSMLELERLQSAREADVADIVVIPRSV